MDKNIIKENLTSVLFVVITLSAGFIYLITEYKELENTKSIQNQEFNKNKIKLNNQKHEVKLMQKDLENQILQAKLKYKDNLTKITNLQNKSNSIDVKNFQQYQIKINTLINKKDIKIENLINKINIQNNDIITLNEVLLKLKKKKKELSIFIDNINNAEKISKRISNHLKTYANINKNSYKKRSDYLQAIGEYESIHSLIKTYKLTQEYSPFIRDMKEKYYVNN